MNLSPEIYRSTFIILFPKYANSPVKRSTRAILAAGWPIKNITRFHQTMRAFYCTVSMRRSCQFVIGRSPRLRYRCMKTRVQSRRNAFHAKRAINQRQFAAGVTFTFQVNSWLIPLCPGPAATPDKWRRIGRWLSGSGVRRGCLTRRKKDRSRKTRTLTKCS